MSFRGGRGGSFGGSQRGGRGGFGGGNNRYPRCSRFRRNHALGTFMHASEGDMFCKSINEKIPYFNAQSTLKTRPKLVKSTNPRPPLTKFSSPSKVQEGVVASSFKANDKVFIGTDKLCPLIVSFPSQRLQRLRKPHLLVVLAEELVVDSVDAVVPVVDLVEVSVVVEVLPAVAVLVVVSAVLLVEALAVVSGGGSSSRGSFGGSRGGFRGRS